MGDLRFQLPVANDPYSGDYDATVFGDSCIQQAYNDSDISNQNSAAIELMLSMASAFAANVTDSEDCRSASTLR